MFSTCGKRVQQSLTLFQGYWGCVGLWRIHHLNAHFMTGKVNVVP